MSNIEMCRLHTTLCYRVRSQEEIKFSIYNVRLFNKSLINICSLRWIKELLRTLFLKEPLPHSFVYKDKSHKRMFIWCSIYFSNDLFQLIKLMMNDLSSHCITNTISVHKDMIWHLTVIELFV